MLYYSYCALLFNTFAHCRLKTKGVDQSLAWLFAVDLSHTEFLMWGNLTFSSILEIQIIPMLFYHNKSEGSTRLCLWAWFLLGAMGQPGASVRSFFFPAAGSPVERQEKWCWGAGGEAPGLSKGQAPTQLCCCLMAEQMSIYHQSACRVTPRVMLKALNKCWVQRGWLNSIDFKGARRTQLLLQTLW